MRAEYVRDAAAAAAILGLFASSWFGWAQEDPPRSWRKWLLAGAVGSILTAIAGGFLAWRHWSSGTVFDDGTSRTFGIIVGIECASAALGAAVLAIRRKPAFIPAWIAFVVGMHFFPLAGLLRLPLLYVTATLITLSAVAAVPVARIRSVLVSAVTGVTTGASLLVSALFSFGMAVL